MSYHTLAIPCQAIYEIKKSQFIAHAYPIAHKQDIMFHVEQLKSTYPDARHYCLAYILGDPHNTTHAGFDDDGEPTGTAGRPILNVLQHKAIGNVLVVVVRYFGGIKLGAGGLTRAYATATQMVVDEMRLVPFVAKSELNLSTAFANEAQVRYLVAQAGGEILAVTYKSEVKMRVQLNTEKCEAFVASLGILATLSDD